MELSLFFELETADMSDAGVKRTFDQCVEQVLLADQLGYKGVWFTEHQFLPGFSYSSSPELVLSHLAAKTKNIRLLDQVLFDESRNPIRDQEAYFFSIFGEPTAKDWGWRVEGHHLSLNFTVHDGQVASSTLFSSAPILPKSAGARALACAFWPQRKKWAVGCCVLCRGRSERKR